MTHATVYLPGHSEWNESLATVVGIRGRGAVLRRARRRRRRPRSWPKRRGGATTTSEAFSRFLAPVVRSLESLYAQAALPRDAKLRERERIFADARKQYLTLFPPPPGKKPGVFAAAPLNNAVVLSFSVYHASTPEHRTLLARARRRPARVHRAVQARRRGRGRSARLSRPTCGRGRSRRRSVCRGAWRRR